MGGNWVGESGYWVCEGSLSRRAALRGGTRPDQTDHRYSQLSPAFLLIPALATTLIPGKTPARRPDFTAAARGAPPPPEQYMAGNPARGRSGEPDDIGGVVASLGSDAARWVNARRLVASGGYSL
ncbi:hypothetical protein GCM10022408_24230 [Hymenobacter fastidiosus]|uniref:Uncharacterized protein n=1 Tax=Hymenobacter fastidiosus TaxID=486264 RepID=A0ABP7SFL0_9BACT